MLIEFAVTNFRSIRDEQALSLLVAKALKELPDNILPGEDMPGLKGERFLRGAAIFGANASGKSTVIMAVGHLKKLLFDKHPQTGDPIDITPFALDDDDADGERPTIFRIHFATGDGSRFEYGLAINRKQVLQEALTAYPAGKAQNVFKRTLIEETKQYRWDMGASLKKSGIVDLLADFTLENTPFVSDLARLKIPALVPFFEWFKNNLRCIDLAHAGDLDESESTEILRTDSALALRLKQVVRTADLGISDIELKVNSTTGRASIKFLHMTPGGKSVSLPLESESAGTRRYYAVMGPMLRALVNGDTVFIDEMETSLHPLMVRELVKLFHNPATNPSGAQLVFTSHNPILLDTDLLRRDQIWFTDKDAGGATHLYPLTNYAPRRDESLLRGYAGGRYGAIPFMPEGLSAAFKPTPEPKAEDDSAR